MICGGACVQERCFHGGGFLLSHIGFLFVTVVCSIVPSVFAYGLSSGRYRLEHLHFRMFHINDVQARQDSQLLCAASIRLWSKHGGVHPSGQ